MNLAHEIASRLANPLPVRVLIDSYASVLGEHLFGAGRGCDDLVYIGIGSGLGGGILSNGRLVTGANQAAAMIGHMSIDPDGFHCRCGHRGCAETIVSGPGLVRLTLQFLHDTLFSTELLPDETLEPQKIVAAARQGDDLARAVIDEVGKNLGIVLSYCAAVLNPARIVIGEDRPPQWARMGTWIRC